METDKLISTPGDDKCRTSGTSQIQGNGALRAEKDLGDHLVNSQFFQNGKLRHKERKSGACGSTESWQNS